MAKPKYFLGKFLDGKATPEEIKQKESETDIELSDPYNPSATGLLLDGYGPDKLAEVQEALDIAKYRTLGDISILLGAWIMNDAQEKAGGIEGVSQATLGPKSTADTEGVIGEFITGIKGSVPSQTQKLKKQFDDAKAAVEETWRAAAQDSGEDEESFVKFAMGDLKARLRKKGGRRKTLRRKSKKTLRRKAKKSRRTYK